MGEISNKFPTFHACKWEEIIKDLELAFPKFYDVRKPLDGILEKTDKRHTEGKLKGENKHCILEFRSL